MSGKTGYRKLSPSSLIQTATNLKVHCEKDKGKLISAGFSWSTYEKLVELIREVQNDYTRILLYREDRKCESYSLKVFARVCIDFRSFFRELLLNSIEHNTIVKIPGMSQRKSYIDISQDLLCLAVTAERILNKFPDCRIPPELIARSRDYSSRLFSMSSNFTVSYPAIPTYALAYEKTKQELLGLIKHIRCIGRNAFRVEPLRKRAYLS
jgi:hypothetical protein